MDRWITLSITVNSEGLFGAVVMQEREREMVRAQSARLKLEPEDLTYEPSRKPDFSVWCDDYEMMKRVEVEVGYVLKEYVG